MTNKPRKWIIIEKAEISHYLFAALPIASITRDMVEIGFPNVDYGGSEYTREKANYIFPRKIWMANGDKYLGIVIKNPKKVHSINQDIIKYSQEMFEYGKDLLKKDYHDLSNKELGDLYNKFEYLHNEAHFRRGVMWVMETPNELFSKHVISQLGKQIKKQRLKLQPGVVFAILATPIKKNYTALEQQEFLKIIIQIKKQNNIDDKLIENRLKKHHIKYCWLPYGMSGPVWGIDYFIKQAKIYLKKDIEKLIEENEFLKNQIDHIKERQAEYLSKLDLSDEIIQMIDIARESIFIKSFSKDALFFGFYSIEKLLREIGKRLDINLDLVRRMLPWEIKKALVDGKINKKELEKRYEYSVQYSYNGNTKIYTGSEAKKFMNTIEVEVEKGVNRNIKKIKGVCAQPGKAAGLVKIINNADDLNKMEEGDILVSQMTDPEIVAAMKKAGAIITDMGGITCHAAIVSRELGIPCVIGTKYATKAFEDGDRVKVDADKGIVKKI